MDFQEFQIWTRAQESDDVRVTGDLANRRRGGFIFSRATDRKAHPQNRTGFPDMPHGSGFFSRENSPPLSFTPHPSRGARCMIDSRRVSALFMLHVAEFRPPSQSSSSLTSRSTFTNEGSRVHVTQLDRLIRDTFRESYEERAE